MTQRRISTVFFGVGLVAALVGLVSYGIGFWLTSDGSVHVAAGISMMLGIFCVLLAGLSIVLSLIAKIWERR
jgi:hypothetical protein